KRWSWASSMSWAGWTRPWPSCGSWRACPRRGRRRAAPTWPRAPGRGAPRSGARATPGRRKARGGRPAADPATAPPAAMPPAMMRPGTGPAGRAAARDPLDYRPGGVGAGRRRPLASAHGRRCGSPAPGAGGGCRRQRPHPPGAVHGSGRLPAPRAAARRAVVARALAGRRLAPRRLILALGRGSVLRNLWTAYRSPGKGTLAAEEGMPVPRRYGGPVLVLAALLVLALLPVLRP